MNIKASSIFVRTRWKKRYKTFQIKKTEWIKRVMPLSFCARTCFKMAKM